jgi:hypothetical protein
VNDCIITRRKGERCSWFPLEMMRAAGAAAAKVNRGYLSDPPDNPPVVLSLDAIELGALDLWIQDQPDPKPARQEAARMLINEALMVSK